MYNTPPTKQVARKEHRCTWCCEKILPGETYLRWATYDASCVTNKMHLECDRLAASEGDYEYVVGEGQRPAPGEFGRPASSQTVGAKPE